MGAVSTMHCEGTDVKMKTSDLIVSTGKKGEKKMCNLYEKLISDAKLGSNRLAYSLLRNRNGQLQHKSDIMID